MSILRSRTSVAGAILVLSMLFAWSIPSQAGAATTTYPSGNSSTFAGGNGGWTSSTDYAGLCVPSVTCPQLTGSYQSSGGAAGAGDGYIRTDSGATTLLSLLSTSTQTWQSPAFTYNGVGGKDPENLRFSLGVNPGVTALLNLGVSVEVSARAVAVSGGGDQTLIDAVSPGNSAGWKTLNSQIGPGALEVGKQYRIEISVAIGGLAAVLPAGTIGFDDVSLRATGPSGGNGNGNGNNPGGVAPPPKVVPPGQGYLYGGRLYIRIKCPARFRPVCRSRAVVLTRINRGKAMSRVAKVRVRTGKFKRASLVIKPQFRKRLRALAKVKHKTLIVRVRFNSNRGKRNGKVFQNLRVLQRHR